MLRIPPRHIGQQDRARRYRACTSRHCHLLAVRSAGTWLTVRQERLMSDEDGIRRTIAQYCQLFDSKQWDELGQIFAEDASVSSRRGTFQGRENVIRDLQSAMTADYHGTLFSSNVLIRVDGDTASAVTDFMEVEDTSIVATGIYRDTFVRSGDSWLLASKKITLK